MTTLADYHQLSIKDLTHSELIEMAIKWLANTKRCLVVAAEIGTLNHETPDAIGFRADVSYLVECKTSKADFLADGKKITRQHPKYGLGNYRYYMCPPKIIQEFDLPDKWGLLWAYYQQIRIVREVDKWNERLINESLMNGERRILYSLMRRAIIRGHAPKIWRGGE